VITTLTRLGVTPATVPGLAMLELLGAIGLVAGLAVPAVGVAAAAGLALYFLGAVAYHRRAGDGPRDVGAPVVLAALAVLAAVARALA